MDKGTWQPDPSREVGEWEECDRDEMDTKLNDMKYQTCPFNLNQFIHCGSPVKNLGV